MYIGFSLSLVQQADRHQVFQSDAVDGHPLANAWGWAEELWERYDFLEKQQQNRLPRRHAVDLKSA
jgi:hypothetical protein